LEVVGVGLAVAMALAVRPLEGAIAAAFGAVAGLISAADERPAVLLPFVTRLLGLGLVDCDTLRVAVGLVEPFAAWESHRRLHALAVKG
jgi:hypothetical protein